MIFSISSVRFSFTFHRIWESLDFGYSSLYEQTVHGSASTAITLLHLSTGTSYSALLPLGEIFYELAISFERSVTDSWHHIQTSSFPLILLFALLSFRIALAAAARVRDQLRYNIIDRQSLLPTSSLQSVRGFT